MCFLEPVAACAVCVMCAVCAVLALCTGPAMYSSACSPYRLYCSAGVAYSGSSVASEQEGRAGSEMTDGRCRDGGVPFPVYRVLRANPWCTPRPCPPIPPGALQCTRSTTPLCSWTRCSLPYFQSTGGKPLVYSRPPSVRCSVQEALPPGAGGRGVAAGQDWEGRCIPQEAQPGGHPNRRGPPAIRHHGPPEAA